MIRKVSLLAATLFSSALVISGLSIAADDDKKSELHEMMETVNAKNGAIRKAVNSLAAWNKADKKKVVADTDELVKIGEKTRNMTEPAQKNKKPQADWTKAMDAYIASAKDLSSTLSKDGTKQPDAKKAFMSLQKTCGDCHKDFRKEDEGF